MSSTTRPKCPGHCPHYADQHSAAGGCMNVNPAGAACGCTWTAGPQHGANPFDVLGSASTLPF